MDSTERQCRIGVARGGGVRPSPICRGRYNQAMRTLPGGTFTGIIAAVVIPVVSVVGAIIAAIVLAIP